ncbi:MAG TPA: DUF6600 domain-containing protein [Terracidiphilus sp.]
MAAFNRPRKLAWPLVTAIAVLALCAGATTFAQDNDDPPPQAGRLSAVNGAVSVQPAGSQDWGQAYLNLPLAPGDRIFTDQDGRAEIQIGRTWLRIAPNSDVTLVEASDSAVTFGVAQGTAVARTQGLWPNQNLYVQTPSGTVTVNQPAGIRVDVVPEDQSAVFSDRWGTSFVSGAGDFSQPLEAKQTLELTGTNPVTPQWLQPIARDDFELWNDQRNQAISQAASWKYVSPDLPGGEDLDANGEWLPQSDYGPVWYPRVAAGWAPYRNGHWANRAPWGWIWVEDEPWGYAPFHFGRWVAINGRWGWVPGPREARPVWSPALVVFVGGGQPGMSAWIPLGPGEPYRPWYRCSSRYVDAVNISNIRPAPRVVVQKTYVNVVNVNVTNITYVNRTSVTVVRQDDFAAGHSVARAAMRVDPVQFSAHISVVVAPKAPERPISIVSAPPARPVRVAAARPELINARGQMVAAQPHAQPQAPPVKAVAAPKALPGRTAVAPPPNAKAQPGQPRQQPGARQGNQPVTPGAHPGQPNQPAGGGPAQPQNKGNQPAAGQPQGQPKPNPPPGNAAGAGQTQPKPNQPNAPAGQQPGRTPAPGQTQGNPNQQPGQKPPAQNKPAQTPPGQTQPTPGQTQPKPNQQPGTAPKPQTQSPQNQQQPGQQQPDNKNKDKNKKPAKPDQQPQPPNA